MEYHGSVHVAKLLTRVIVHMEVTRQDSLTGQDVIVWQYTDMVDEQAHPEPVKWLREHIFEAFQEMP